MPWTDGGAGQLGRRSRCLSAAVPASLFATRCVLLQLPRCRARRLSRWLPYLQRGAVHNNLLKKRLVQLYVEAWHARPQVKEIARRTAGALPVSVGFTDIQSGACCCLLHWGSAGLRVRLVAPITDALNFR